MVKKPPERRKNFFPFFYNFFHIFPLPLRKKTKPLTFSALFLTGNRKTARENVLLKTFFFFLLFSTLPLFFFFIIYFKFSLSPYGQKQNHLLFPPFISLEIEKPQGKTSHKKFFFFFYLTFLDPTAPRNRKNYHLPFFSKFRLKVP